MSWISWTSLVPTLLILSASLAWWLTEPKNARINLIAASGVVLFCWAVAPELTRQLSYSLYMSSVNAIAGLGLEVLIVRHANMLLTGAAVVWLLRRALQTLWKPVPELINILGVDVPDPPDVSLAGIRADAATVNWTRPPANRSVQKFLIQVNGVVVGEVAANQEPAIVVSGLKPDHFYNVRVIAVGSNNFQSGSRVIRLRTFGRDGRPQLGNSRLPSNFTADEPHGAVQGENVDENGVLRSSFPALESAVVPEGTASPARDGSSAATSGSGRRNTVTRKHSPSTTSMDQSTREELSAYSKKSLPELNEKFESIRKETEDVTNMIVKEEADNKKVLEELEAEKMDKKKEQKKKEEQTERLKRDVNSTDRSMRNAMQRKAQREKLLKEKQAERSRLYDNISKWEKGMNDMRNDREGFEQQKQELEEERDQKIQNYHQVNHDLQTECSKMECELKERREQVKELEEARKTLPGGDDDSGWREKDAELRREWNRKNKDLAELVNFETKRYRDLEEQIRRLQGHLHQANQANYGMYNVPNPPGVEYDNPTITQLKRRSHTNSSLSNISISSPLPAYSQIDPATLAPTGFSASRTLTAPPGFAPGPFMDLSAGSMGHFDDSGFRGSSAPLSPSATALLPSNILDDFDDDEDDDPSPASKFDPEPFLSLQRPVPDHAPQSPASSGKSLSALSSPRGSSGNLPFPPFQGDITDRMSMNATGTLPSPTVAEPAHKAGGFPSWLRSRPAKVMDNEPPLLGSLKPGQSQSFPRHTDDPDGLPNKRRISLSGTWNMFNRNSVGPEITEGQQHMPNSHMFSRNLNPFSSSRRPAGGLLHERDPSSPRPASIASSEFPRPSTDSNSIWGPSLLDNSTMGKNNRLWSPDAPWSRTPSRRPSLHGSPSALKTTLASADDEILDEETLPNVNQVGVIGSRPPTQSAKALARLNPNAPAFIGSFFKSKPEKEKEKEEKEKAKAEAKAEKAAEKKEKEKLKKESKDKQKSKDKEAAASTPDTPHAPAFDMDSPTDSRKSRDATSIHTLHSLSESRDSLSLDLSYSNTHSEPTSAGLSNSFKEDNVVRKLFRKSSSSKFSLAGRLGGKGESHGSLFKKGPSSTASGGTSEKGGTSIERSSIGDFEDLTDEALNGINLMGQSYDSITSSPGLGTSNAAAAAATSSPVAATSSSSSSSAAALAASAVAISSTNKGKETKSKWLSNFGKKGKKEKEGLELDRCLTESDGHEENMKG